ncbi:trypsin-like peptidase [Micromonospora kangleipakensis]|uniref:Trypsin-like peptidase n=1 Tax=Micromonospora kangleipakensis TaxID=1077942 RepID=A0A4Q8B9E0_9ACTN|nr:trypsin-like peptidase domain-containing protein [Micromonospora kangleipakensis]RZU73755.1 trypsin-like peptidase [Micromonospora kangleipakensis]
MQPVGPYRFTEALGVCQVGTAWWAVDGQDRLVTVAMLEGAAAADPPWREAFANAANAMAQAPGGQRYVNADLAAAHPWVAYPSEEGIGAQRLFQTLGMDLHPLESRADVLIPATGTVSAPSQPVAGAPLSVSGPPDPTLGPPHVPWAMHAAVVPQQQGPEAVPTSPAPAAKSTDSPPADPFPAPVRRIEPSGTAGRGTGLWLTVTALVLGIVAAFGGVSAWAGGRGGTTPSAAVPAVFPTDAPAAAGLRPWGQFTPSSPQERALAVAGPSLVFIEAVVTGYLRDRTTNALVRTSPTVFNRRCTGFVINPDGYVLTSSSCVKPSEEVARQVALDAVAQALVRERKLDAGAVPGYISANLAKTRFTGIDATAEPSIQLSVQFNNAKGNVIGDPAAPGELVKAQAADTGNVALVKLGRQNLPAAEFNPSATVTDAGSLLIAGFGTDDSGSRNATYTPRAKMAKIAGVGRRGSLSTWRIGDDLGRASHGGIAIDPAGRVIGMLDQDLTRPDRANRVVVPASAFTGVMGDAGVTGALGEPDRLYRSGLDAYFTGRYPTAVAQLGTVVEREPGNPLAQAYRENALNRQQMEAVPASAPAWAWWLLAGAGGALLILLVLLVATLGRRYR